MWCLSIELNDEGPVTFGESASWAEGAVADLDGMGEAWSVICCKKASVSGNAVFEKDRASPQRETLGRKQDGVRSYKTRS